MKYLKKLVDFFKSVKPVPKKDKNLLKARRQYRPGRWYVYDTKLLRIERCNPTFYLNGRNNAITRLPSDQTRVLDS
jgi:hypothetical protein